MQTTMARVVPGARPRKTGQVRLGCGRFCGGWSVKAVRILRPSHAAAFLGDAGRSRAMITVTTRTWTRPAASV